MAEDTHQNLKPSEYIDQSGGVGKFADQDRIVVIKPNGDAEVIQARLFFSYSIQPSTLAPQYMCLERSEN